MVFKKIALTVMSVVVSAALLTGCGNTVEPQTSQPAASSEAAVPSETLDIASTEEESPATEEATTEETTADATAATQEAAAPAVDPNDQSLQKILDKGQLVIGTSADYPPYEFHRLMDGKDQILGLDIQLADEIAKEMGVDVKIVDMNYDGLLMALQSGQVDMVMAAMTPNETRKKTVDFSDIYYQATQTVVTRKDDAPNINTPADLAGKKIGVQKGSLQETIAKEQFPDSRVVSLTKVPSIVLELEKNKVDAVIMETAVAEGYLKQYPTLGASACPAEDPTGGTAIAMKKGSGALVQKTNEIIQRLQSEGKIDEFMRIATEQNTQQ